MIPRCTSHLIKISHFFGGKLNKYTVRGYRWFQGAFRIIILVLLVVTTAGVSITANYRRQHLQLLKLKSHILYVSLITKIKNKHCWLFFPFTFRNDKILWIFRLVKNTFGWLVRIFMFFITFAFFFNSFNDLLSYFMSSVVSILFNHVRMINPLTPRSD